MGLTKTLLKTLVEKLRPIGGSTCSDKVPVHSANREIDLSMIGLRLQEIRGYSASSMPGAGASAGLACQKALEFASKPIDRAVLWYERARAEMKRDPVFYGPSALTNITFSLREYPFPEVKYPVHDALALGDSLYAAIGKVDEDLERNYCENWRAFRLAFSVVTGYRSLDAPGIPAQIVAAAHREQNQLTATRERLLETLDHDVEQATRDGVLLVRSES